MHPNPNPNHNWRLGFRSPLHAFLNGTTNLDESGGLGHDGFVRCSFHPPDGEWVDDIESYLERHLNNPSIQIRVRYRACHSDGGMDYVDSRGTS